MLRKSIKKHPAYSAAATLMIVIAFCIWLVGLIINQQKQRDENEWQITLGLIIEGRVKSINRWINGEFASLQELSKNGSLQLYIQQVLKTEDDTSKTIKAQKGYLKNLVLSHAQRSGFIDLAPQQQIRANVATVSLSGIAITNAEGKVITATPGILPLSSALLSTIARSRESNKPQITPLLHRKFSNGKTAGQSIGFVVPVYGLSGLGKQQQLIAMVIGFKNTADEFFHLLQATGSTIKTDEAYLIRQKNNNLYYESPLNNGSAVGTRQLDSNTVHLVAAHGVSEPGSFGQGINYANQHVFYTSRRINETPWTLLQTIQHHEAMHNAEKHRTFLLTTLLLMVFLISALLIAAWRHGTSVREQKYSHALLTKSQALEAQTILLNAVTNNIRDHIFLMDESSHLVFANQQIATLLNMDANAFPGKTLGNVFGDYIATIFKPLIKIAETKKIIKMETLKISLGEQSGVYHAVFIPLIMQNGSAHILVTLHDVTELQKAQEHRTRLVEQLVAAMMNAIDMHDPFSANHSARTTILSTAIAEQMQYNSTDLDTLRIAASICNIGKLFIPSEILTKTGKLTAAETAELFKEAEYSNQILADIEFDGPVLTTITQKHEYIDGSGKPNKLKGDEIHALAKILSVADAFIAMTSPRAYRDKMNVQKAQDILYNDSKTRYDRSVVASLINVIENSDVLQQLEQ